MNARETFDLDPIEIDPRPCELCGLTIDRHITVDDGEGPLFFCREEDDLVRQWELADPRDRWRHTGEARPTEAMKPRRDTAPYRTAQSTIAAFWVVAKIGDAEYLAAWLTQHPLDVMTLQKLWDGKHARI
jgi:hypothetical protein